MQNFFPDDQTSPQSRPPFSMGRLKGQTFIYSQFDKAPANEDRVHYDAEAQEHGDSGPDPPHPEESYDRPHEDCYDPPHWDT